MSSKKEEKAQAAADRIKAAAMSAAKGLSRSQAERAAAAAARNVNAYGQKEEGPSRWQERKEAKRQMYLMSTEKAVRLGERKDIKSNMTTIGGAVSQCQKCFQSGHWTYECKNERVYISRPSRSQLLKNPKLRQKMMTSYNADNPDIKDEEVKEKSDKRRKKSKRKDKSDTDSGTESDSSVFESDSGSSSGSESGSRSESGSDYSSEDSGSSDISSSDSDTKRRNNKRKQKRSRKKRYSSSESSDYESSSDSDSQHKRRRKSKKHSRRR